MDIGMHRHGIRQVYQVDRERIFLAPQRGLLILMHERSLTHLSAISLSEKEYQEQTTKGGLPLFTNFLLNSKRNDKTSRYMIRIAVFSRVFRQSQYVR
jgi:hypothetical protein